MEIPAVTDTAPLEEIARGLAALNAGLSRLEAALENRDGAAAARAADAVTAAAGSQVRAVAEIIVGAYRMTPASPVPPPALSVVKG